MELRLLLDTAQRRKFSLIQAQAQAFLLQTC
jgi:hypothetical protein